MSRNVRAAAAPVRQPDEVPSRLAAAGPDVRPREMLAVSLSLALAIWVAHYWHFRQFGLYEDDWFFVGFPLLWNWHTAAQTAWSYLVQWPQGRPVSFACSALLAFVGTQAAGIAGAYALAFLINAASAVLLYRVARRFVPPPAAFCGALAFNLMPSVTSSAFLTNAFMPGVGLFFSLASLTSYLARRRWAAYLFAALTLLSYESCFLPLFAAPVLACPWQRLRRELARHTATLASMAAMALLIRHHIGEAKVVTLAGSLRHSLERVVSALYLGPRTTLLAFGRRPVTLWHERSLEIGLAVAACALIAGAALFWLDARGGRSADRRPARVWSDPLVRLAVFGAATFAGGYALAITPPYFPPVVIDGRITGLHLAASIGCGLLAAAAFALAGRLARGRPARMAVLALAALYLAVLAGFQYRVQQDFIVAWHFERQFWREVVRLCPDIDENTVIVHETAYLPVSYVDVYDWTDAIVLDKLFAFPPAWRHVPRVYSLPREWEDDVAVQGDQFTWGVPAGLWVPHREVLPRGDLILLRGKLDRVDPVRAAGSVVFRGRPFPLKAPGPPVLPSLPEGPFYALLLGR